MAINVTENLMARLNPKWVERFKKVKGYQQRVALVRDYPIQTHEEEAVIQLLVDKLDPAMPSQTRVTAVRAEMQRDEAKGVGAEHRLDTPEGEKYWQGQLDSASSLDELDRKAEVARRHAEIRKLFPGLLVDEEGGKEAPPSSSLPAITVNPKTKEATVADPTQKNAPMPNPVPNGATTEDLSTLPGFGKKTVDNFIEHGVVCQRQLFELTYSQALVIARTPLVLAKIKDKFKSEK